MNLKESRPQSLEQTVFHAEILMGMEDFQMCLGKTYEYQENYLASTATRQKAEIKTKDLTPEEAKLFAKAKDKELDSWLATNIVRKILRDNCYDLGGSYLGNNLMNKNK